MYLDVLFGLVYTLITRIYMPWVKFMVDVDGGIIHHFLNGCDLIIHVLIGKVVTVCFIHVYIFFITRHYMDTVFFVHSQ